MLLARAQRPALSAPASLTLKERAVPASEHPHVPAVHVALDAAALEHQHCYSCCMADKREDAEG